MRTLIGIALPLISITILLWIEQVLEVEYVWKTVAKAILFLFIPFILFRKSGFPFLHLHKSDRKSMRIAIVSGVAIMVTIIVAFMILQPFIDIGALLDDLADAGVTPTVFPFVAVYILFGNSYWRSFSSAGSYRVFLKSSHFRLFLPSFFFAIYHIAIFLPWFSPGILLV